MSTEYEELLERYKARYFLLEGTKNFNMHSHTQNINQLKTHSKKFNIISHQRNQNVNKDEKQL